MPIREALITRLSDGGPSATLDVSEFEFVNASILDLSIDATMAVENDLGTERGTLRVGRGSSMLVGGNVDASSSSQVAAFCSDSSTSA